MAIYSLYNESTDYVLNFGDSLFVLNLLHFAKINEFVIITNLEGNE